MADKPFVINDRRKFTAEGDIRPDAPPSEPTPIRQPEPAPASSSAASQQRGPQAVPNPPQEAVSDEESAAEMPPLTTEQIEQATRAYQATVDRLDTAIRAANPGMEIAPGMTFDRLIQSVYMQCIYQLGGGQPEGGQPPQVDLLGARNSIDMLGVIAEKTAGNMSEGENRLLQSALFEMRMGFLEVTQALARQASARQPQGGFGGPAPVGGGPSILR